MNFFLGLVFGVALVVGVLYFVFRPPPPGKHAGDSQHDDWNNTNFTADDDYTDSSHG